MPHAELSPSSAHRWIACPGSVALCRGLPDEGSSFAREGTIAHALAQRCLTDGTDAAAHLDTVIADGDAEGTVTADMAENVQVHLDYVRNLGADVVMVEESVPIDHITLEEGARGTADVIAVKGTTMHVIDLKYGRGVRVDSEENPQLALYALGAMALYGDLFDVQSLRVSIVQPRLNHISEWEVPISWLAGFAEKTRRAAVRAMQPTEFLRAGEDQCKFCRAKGHCPELARVSLEAVVGEFPDLSADPAPLVEAATRRELSTGDLSRLLPLLPLIEDWCGAIRGRALRELENGASIPGWKVVAGREGQRKWINEAEAARVLLEAGLGEDDIYTRELLSPTQAGKNKRLAGVDLSDLVARAPGKPTLVPESDPREAIGAVEDAFSVLGES